MLLNAKPVAFGNLLVLPIVVEVPRTAGIFDTFFCRKAMAHFVQKRGAGFLDWAAKCGAADVDFISPLVSCLTIEEAAAYFGIGVNKLREMTDSKTCTFVIFNGTKRLIKRAKLEEYLDDVDVI